MERQLIGLTAIVTLGFTARWIAWRLKFPAILLLLLFGLAAGPATGLLHPDELFGALLLPAVSISVALILFEGGLGLRFRDLRETAAVRNLVTIGALLTWLLATGLAMAILGMHWKLALLLGAILTVTGPTVVLPLLQHVRPKGQVATVARWEGILIDPIGALLAVLAYEAIAANVFDGWSSALIWRYCSGVLIGALAGVVTAALIVGALRAFLIPDSLLNPFSLAAVVGTFTLSNHIRPETGLVAVTVMGVVLANQRWVSVHRILEFKEDLRVLLISSLFIILAARLSFADLRQLGPGAALFIAALIFVVRPAAVLVSTIRSGLTRAERTFLAGLAPRGIVAVAVSSILAGRLVEAGVDGARIIVPLVFMVVIVTVAVYGLGAAPLANWLGIADADPQGILIVGAHRKLVELAGLLQRENIAVAFIDSDWSNVTRARIKGFPAYYGNPASEEVTTGIDLQGIGRVIAFTPSPDTNSLAALHLSRLFGRAETYQVRASAESSDRKETARHLSGRPLFAPDVYYDNLVSRFDRGYVFKTTPLTPLFGVAEFQAMYGLDAIPFCLIHDNGKKLTILTHGFPDTIPPGSRVICLIPPQHAEPEATEHDVHITSA
ncbi:MAG: sodium:proton antiporter [Bryobacteraceae bacterium]